MIKLRKLLLSVTVIAGLFSVSANAALIFSNDSASFNSAITLGASDNFEDLGVLPNEVLGLANTETRGDFTYSASGASALVGLGAGIGGLTSVGFAPDQFGASLTIDIIDGYNAFGFDYTATIDETLNVSVFDMLDNLLGTTNVATTPSSMMFLGFVSDVAIGRILLDDGSLSGLVIDNVVAGSTDVPEPSTLTVLALGLLGLASRRFKK